MLSSLGERTDVPIVRLLAVTTGSAPSLSPGRKGGHNGSLPLKAWVSEPGYGIKCVWPALVQTQIVLPFAGIPGQSPPEVFLLKMLPDPRGHQGWDGSSRGDWSP